MLVLSRKRGESIIINENIIVTVVDIRRDKVRLGIESPRETSLSRGEASEALREESESWPSSQTHPVPEPPQVTLENLPAKFVEQTIKAVRNHNRLFEATQSDVVNAVLEGVIRMNLNMREMRSLQELTDTIANKG